MLGFRLSQGLFYLSAGVWLGALVMLVVTASATFATVRAYQPALPIELELAGEADAILAGAIVGRSLDRLMVVQLVCAAGACLALTLEHTRYAGRLARRGRSAAARVRSLALLVAVVMVAANLAWIGPGVWQSRAVMYDASASGQERAAARAVFDRYHRLSERTHGLAALALAGALLAGPFVAGKGDDS